MKVTIYVGLIGLVIFASLYVMSIESGDSVISRSSEPKLINPEEMLLNVIDDSRYVSTHFIARRIIDGDPSLFLIDVRMMYEFEEYNIPGSFNIPLEELLFPDWEAYINQDGMDVVFYSNGDIYADQAWMLSTQIGYQNLYVMKGGLNEWFRTIIQPTPPDETAPNEAFEKYSFERAASIYFGGSSAVATTAPAAKKKVVVRKKEKKAAEGGC